MGRIKIVGMIGITLAVLFLSSFLADDTQAMADIEFTNPYNITGISSNEDPLDFEPIQKTMLLAINEDRDRLDIWNISTESIAYTIYTNRMIRDIASSPDGQFLAVIGSWDLSMRNHTLAVYDTESWTDCFTGEESPSEWSTDGAWSSDGEWFALGSQDGSIYIYDTADWHTVTILKGPDTTEVKEIEFSSDRELLAAVIGENIRVFNLTDWQVTWSNKSGDGTVRWMPDTHNLLQNQNKIVDGDNDWNLVETTEGFFGRFHPCDKYLAMGDWQTLSIYDTEDWSRYPMGKIFDANFNDLKWGMDGDVLYTYGDNSTIRCLIVIGGVLDDQPPSVNVKFPSEGQSIDGQMYAYGTATDDHGVDYVFLKIDDNAWQLANGTNSWSWLDFFKLISPGNHTLFVRSMDGTYYSPISVVNFTLIGIPMQNQPPRLYLLSPQNGDAIEGILRIILYAEDEQLSVIYEIGVDDTELLNVTESLVLNRTLDISDIPEGMHRVWARAFDGTHWSTTVEANVTVTVPSEPDKRPIVSITRPIHLEIVFGNVTIAGTTFDDHAVDFVVVEVDGLQLAVLPDGWEFSVVWDTLAVADGYHNITAWAWDGVQRSGNTTVRVLVRQPENYFNRVGLVILQPLPGQQLSGVIDVKVGVTSEPIGYFPEWLWLKVDDLTPVGSNVTEDLVIQFDTNLVVNGLHTFHVWMNGHGLQSDVVELQVTVNNAVDLPNDPPTLGVVYPTDGEVILGTTELRGTAFDDHGLLTVEVRVDNGPWTSAEGGLRWTYQWDSTAVEEGMHRLRFRSFDGEKYSDEVSVEIVVDNAREDSEPDGQSLVVVMLGVLLLVVAVVALYIWSRQRDSR
jgi:WD40 repeat protein